MTKGRNYKPSNIIRDETLEDLDIFIKILEDEHITVKRPTVMTESKKIKSPWWEAYMGHAMMSRDLFIIIGDEIIETSPLLRSRYFEGDLYKELFTEYLKQGAKWTAAPKSRLMDHNFDYSYVIKNGMNEIQPDNSYFEIMFDGAQILRMGKDMFFNCSNENHRLGKMWLQRHIGNKYRIHELNITDAHIDGLILPLKPGVLLVNRKVNLDQIPEKLKKWKIIWYDSISQSAYTEGNIPTLASTSIGMNVLSIDEKKVIVQDIQVELIKSLQSEGFEPIPCRWRHGRVLGVWYFLRKGMVINMNIKQKIIDIISVNFENANQYLCENDDLTILGLNSVSFIQIAVNLEIEFGLEFDDEALDYKNFK